MLLKIVIATPARLNDILENHGKSLISVFAQCHLCPFFLPADDIDLSHVQAFVLDEVDCLLHMGFELQVKHLGCHLVQRIATRITGLGCASISLCLCLVLCIRRFEVLKSVYLARGKISCSLPPFLLALREWPLK